MALTNIYVDPSIAGDSGNGAIDNAYGDLEYAIEQTTFDTTNGTRVNIKAGTDEVLVASLETAMANTTTTAAWATSETAQCVFQGYTSTSGDGGIGGISGGGSVGIIGGDSLNYVSFIDCHLHNTGSNDVVGLNNFCSIVRCEINNSSGNALDIDSSAVVFSCYIHDIGGQGCFLSTTSFVSHCFFANGTKTFSTAITAAANALIIRNIVKVSGSTNGINVNESSVVMHNAVWSDGGTASGIFSVSNVIGSIVMNNIVEGFSTSAGKGFRFDNSNYGLRIYGGNAAWDNVTNYIAPTKFVLLDLGDNESLSNTAFTDAANNDFSPIDIGNVKEGSLPSNFAGP
jgi:hypothetical protein